MLLVAVVGFLLIFVLPSFVSEFRLNLLGTLFAFAIIAIGLDLLCGCVGMLGLGLVVFCGLGGYAMAMFMKLEAQGGTRPAFMTWCGLNSLPWFWQPFEHWWFATPIA